ncbi:MAG: hypothetical protein P1S60_09720, partial [Anaerolineae bacterium]|nr:hypothetical protein [Anaerolineae bacterium]
MDNVQTIHSTHEDKPPILDVENIQNTLRAGQQALIRRILRAISILGLFALGTGLYEFISTGVYTRLVMLVTFYIALLFVTYIPRVAYRLQAGVLLFVVYSVGLINLLTTGLFGTALLFLFSGPILATLLFNRRAGIILTLLVISSVVFTAVLFLGGMVPEPTGAMPDFGDAGFWVTGGVVFIILTVLLTLIQSDYYQRFATALGQEQQVSAMLAAERANLEERIAERTDAFVRRAQYLEASAFVAREASGVIEDSAELLQQVVDLISQQFGFYHTGLFLIDDSGEWAELKAASSIGGERMLTR